MTTDLPVCQVRGKAKAPQPCLAPTCSIAWRSRATRCVKTPAGQAVLRLRLALPPFLLSPSFFLSGSLPPFLIPSIFLNKQAQTYQTLLLGLL